MEDVFPPKQISDQTTALQIAGTVSLLNCTSDGAVPELDES